MLNKLTKIQKILLVDFLIVLGLTIMDIRSIPLWGEPSGTFLSFFWTFATLVIIIASIVWYLATNDKSEAIALGVGAKLMTMFGLEDVLFYLIRDRTFDGNNMIHLFSHPVMGRIAQFMGLETVTQTSLFLSLIIGGIITYYVVNYLVRKL